MAKQQEDIVDREEQVEEKKENELAKSHTGVYKEYVNPLKKSIGIRISNLTAKMASPMRRSKAGVSASGG